MEKTKRFVQIALLMLLLCKAAPPAWSESEDWQVVKIGEREYVSFENVARFYRLRASNDDSGQRPILWDSRVRLEMHGNPREIFVNGVKQWLSFPIVYARGQALISRFDLSKTIEPCLRPTMIANLEPFQTVVLDAGHGGNDGGERSLVGQEKGYTLDVIFRIKKSLEAKGISVAVTRDCDQYLPLEKRADLVNHTVDPLLVSIHFNSSGDASASGFEVFAMTPRGAASTSDRGITPEQALQMPGNDFDNASLALATCVHHSLLGHIPQTDRGVKRARFAVLRLTHAPAILVEGGFLSNGSESRKINDPAWRQKLAESIALGIRAYRDLAYYKQPPKLVADYRYEQLPVRGLFGKQGGVASTSTAGNLSPFPASRIGLFWMDALPTAP